MHLYLVSDLHFIYSKARYRVPFLGPFTYLGREEGPIRSVALTLFRTAGITSRTAIPVWGRVYSRASLPSRGVKMPR